MTSICSFTTGILIVILIASCGSSTTKHNVTNADSIAVYHIPAAQPVSIAERVRIYNASRLWYDTVLQQKGFNGGIIVAKNGQIIFEKYNGTGHLPGTDTINANTPLQIASVSKTFTAMAVLKLAQDGKLNINDDFGKYFPLFNYPGVTIRSLLNHRSGLPNYIYFMELQGWDKTRIVLNEDVLDYLINRKTNLENISAPDHHFTYCNTNYVLLALLIERISGKKYADYLNEIFFRPLQMNNTFVFSLSDSVKMNPTYDWKGRLIAYGFLDGVYGDKNIYSTVRDLLTWDRELTEGNLFSPLTLQLAYTPYSNEKPGTRNYGLGWRLNIYPNGKKIIYHNGWWHGSNSSFIRLPHDSATIIVIGNKFNRAIYKVKLLADIFGNNFQNDNEIDMEVLLNTDSSLENSGLSDTVEIKKQKKIKTGRIKK